MKNTKKKSSRPKLQSSVAASAPLNLQGKKGRVIQESILQLRAKSREIREERDESRANRSKIDRILDHVSV